MGESAAELRQEIEQTRQNMTATVDAIGDRVVPGRILERRKNRILASLDSARSSVMGAPDQARAVLAEGGSTAGEELADLSHTVHNQTQGNPFGAGLIAFGAGMLAATLLPTSDTERRTAAKAKEVAEPLIEPMQHATQELLDSVKEHGQQAVTAVKDAGASAASDLTASAKDAAQQATDQAKPPGPGFDSQKG